MIEAGETAARGVSRAVPPGIVAVVMVALAAGCFAKYESLVRATVAAILCVALVSLAAVDLERRIIPNRVVLPAGAVVLAGNVLRDTGQAWEYVGAAFAALAVASVLSLATRGGLGMGDAKLCFLLGAGLGWSVLGAALIASVASFVVAVAVLAQRGLSARKETFAFGPLLALGGIVTLFIG